LETIAIAGMAQWKKETTMEAKSRRRRLVPLTLLLALLAALAACGDDDDGGTTPTSGEEPSAEGARVAFLGPSTANTFIQAALGAVKEVAAEHDIEITEFDAQFDSALQLRQIQDVIASGDYDGIILNSVAGPEIIPAVEEAIDAGIKVVIANQIVGTDLNTSDPQVDGVSASVLTPASNDGARLGEVTSIACEDIDPCKVVYWFGIKGSPFDDAVRAGFDDFIADHDNIEVVADGEAGFEGPDQAFQAMQDILASTPDIDVAVGPDQGIAGVELALEDAGIEFGVESGVRLLASGGSEAAFEAMEAGRWFGAVFAAPATEGQVAMEQMVEALNGNDTGEGIDVATQFPNNSVITPSNLDEYEPQWAG